MTSIPVQINTDIDVSEMYDDTAIITITGNSHEFNVSITGDHLTVSRCLSILNALTNKGKLKVKKQRVN